MMIAETRAKAEGRPRTNDLPNGEIDAIVGKAFGGNLNS